MDKKRRNVGDIRVWVKVPASGKDVKFVIEWTRHVFGFWYRQDVTVPGAVDDLSLLASSRLKTAINPIRWTADGVTRVASMNRMFRKIKKARSRDRASRAGLRKI